MPVQDVYSGNGVDVDFTIMFAYTSRSFVDVAVSGVPQTNGVDYNFTSASVIRFTTPPASGTGNVTITRNTSTTPIVDFTPSSSLLDTDLDLSLLQAAHIAEEAASEAYVSAQIAEALLTPTTTVSAYIAPFLATTNASAAQAAIGMTVTGRLLAQAVSPGTALGNLGVSAAAATAISQTSNEAIRDSLEVDEDVPRENLVVNSDFQIWQNSGLFLSPNDADYTADQWVILQEANASVFVAQQGPATTGDTPGKRAVTVNQLIADNDWGLLHPIEYNNVQHLTGGAKVTISFWAKRTGTVGSMRFHLAQWRGAPNNITNIDAVGSWNGPAAPTPAASWTFIEPDVLDSEEFAPTTSWQKFSATFTLPGTATGNLAVFIGTNRVSQAAGTSVQITAVNCTEGEEAVPYVSKPFHEELAACQRFFVKTFAYATAPADNAGLANALAVQSVEWGGVWNTLDTSWRFPVQMVKAPTITTYNPQTGTSGYYSTLSAGSVVGPVVQNALGTEGVHLSYIVAHPGLAVATLYYLHAVADARL